MCRYFVFYSKKEPGPIGSSWDETTLKTGTTCLTLVTGILPASGSGKNRYTGITRRSDWLHWAFHWASGGLSFYTGSEALLFHILCSASHTRDSRWVLWLQNHSRASFGWVPSTAVHNLPNVMSAIVNAYMWVFICLPSHVSTCVNPHISICLLLLFFF